MFRVTFSEAVTAVDQTDFVVNGTTTATVTNAVTADSGAGLLWDVTISGGDLAGFNGTVGLNFAGTENITDLAGNALPSTEPTTDQTYVVDNTAPDAPSISGVVNGASSAVTDGSSVTTAQNNFTFTVGLNGTGATAPVAGDTVNLFNGATVVGTKVLLPADITTDSVSFTLTLTAGANQVFTAKVTDVAGNQSAASNTFTLTVT